MRSHSCTVFAVALISLLVLTAFFAQACRKKQLTVGYASYCESSAEASLITQSLKNEARKNNIRLIVADNDMNAEAAVKNADMFINEKIDVFIEYNTAANVNSIIMAKMAAADIPVISIDNEIENSVYFGIDNNRVYAEAGNRIGKKIVEKWDGEIDLVIIMVRKSTGDIMINRAWGALSGLRLSVPVDDSCVIIVDGGRNEDSAYESVVRILRTNPDKHRIGVICCCNDFSGGIWSAAEDMGRVEDLLLVGQGVSSFADYIESTDLPNDSYIGAIDDGYIDYGEPLLQLAKELSDSKLLPDTVITEHSFITVEDFE